MLDMKNIPLIGAMVFLAIVMWMLIFNPIVPGEVPIPQPTATPTVAPTATPTCTSAFLAPAGWSIGESGFGSFQQGCTSTTFYHSSPNSYDMHSRGTVGNSKRESIFQQFPASPGDEFVAQAYLRHGTYTDWSGGLTIQFVNASNVPIVTYDDFESGLVNTDVMHIISTLPRTAPANTVAVRISITIKSSSSTSDANNPWYFDNVRLVLGDDPLSGDNLITVNPNFDL